MIAALDANNREVAALEDHAPLPLDPRCWTLGHAIAVATPAEAAELATEFLRELAAGAPITPLLDARSEAELWAAEATPVEREAYALAALDAGVSLRLGDRKRLMAAMFAGFDPATQAAFARWAADQSAAKSEEAA